MSTIIGSARINELGKVSGGKKGDQTKKEVSTQPFYVSSKGWYVLRAKDVVHRAKIASAMLSACKNDHIGYNQGNRLDVLKYGTNSTVDTECDCSSLVRLCIKEATGCDVGNFTTANEKQVILKSGLFDDIGKYNHSMKLEEGDIIITCIKGHTAVICMVEDIYPLLTKGSKGSYVKILQELLNKNGAHLSVDGDFGELTKIALIDYQARNNLTKDGICGNKTWNKLLKL